MHYNANTGARPSLGRKIKRLSDVNAMGYTPYDQTNVSQNVYPNLEPEQPVQNQYPQDFNQQFIPNQGYGMSQTAPQSYPYNPTSAYAQSVPQMNVFQQPMVQSMAMQYGQQLADTGTTKIKQEVERYVSISKLRYYFAVDTRYVISKLALLFFPFTHADWSIKYEQDGPVQPRYELNAPDLYIPTMAYVTYVLVAGLVLGMQQRFTPEQIGILASSALAWCIVELVVHCATLYIAHIETSLRTLDLLAYSGYKFVGIIFSVLLSLLGARTAYYLSLIYTNLALAFFLVRTLKAQVLASETNTQAYYGQPTQTRGNKRRLYFLLFVAGVQPILSWWLSYHLISDGLINVDKSI